MMVGITSQDMMPMFIYGMALHFGLQMARLGHQPVYGYLFDRKLPGGKYNAFHGSDLWYMFGNLDRSTRPFEDVDHQLSKEMMDNVAAFCKTGVPADTNWLPITSKQKGFRHYDGISKGLAMPAYIRKKMRETLFKNPGPA
jgi:carboxylesterase type B